MDIPERSLILTKAEAATRQVEGAIEALVRGHFDIAITLAGAAEDMIDSPDSLFAYHRDHLNAKELGELEDKIGPAPQSRAQLAEARQWSGNYAVRTLQRGLHGCARGDQAQAGELHRPHYGILPLVDREHRFDHQMKRRRLG